MSGVMFRQLAYVVSFALACSLMAALTLVPMLAGQVRADIRTNGSKQGPTPLGRFLAMTTRWFRTLENGYAGLLHWALNHRLEAFGTALVLFVISLLLIPKVGVELMPATDESEVRVNAEMAVGTRLEVMDQSFQQIERIVFESVPEIQNTVTFLGGSTWRGRGGNTGGIRIALVPVNQRSRSSEAIADDLRRRLRGLPGLKIRVRAGQGLFILRMGTQGGDRVQVEIRGHDIEIADALARQVQAIIEDVDGITDTRVSRETGSPEALVMIDRRKAADMKLTVSKIANMLQTVLSGTTAGQFREAGDEYNIRVQLEQAEKKNITEILDLPVTNSDGEQVVLRNVVQIQPRRGPVLIERKDQQRVIYVTANFSGRDLGSVLADIRRALAGIPVPSEFSIVMGGDYEEQQKSFHELLVSFILALILVYMVMASLYESLRDPFVVMFSVPFALIGVVLILLITGSTFNVQSYIGCIMLGGIVVNNAILLVDHINLLRRRDRMTMGQAIEEAGRRRLRPILMTACTTMLAMLPLAIGLGEGSEAQAPLARAVIGGLASATVITLVVVPLVYTLIGRKTLKPFDDVEQETPNPSNRS
jgi:HAE1 family hydrophobic/amphiphilic exporter-1